jgi:chromosome segregation ATPase
MRNNSRNYLIALVGLTMLGLSSLAFTENQSHKNFQVAGDTLPKPKAAKKDFDKELQDLDRAMKQLQNSPDIDFNKMQKDLDESMKKLQEQMAQHMIDVDKMQKDLKESIEKINTEKIQAQLQASLKQLEKIDVQKLQDELKASLSNIDSEKMRAQIDASLKSIDKIDLEKMEKEIEKSIEEVKVNVHPEEIEKKVRESLEKVDIDKIKGDMNRAKDELEENKGHIKVDLDNAKKDLEKAKQEIQGYQEMVYQMESDKLLSTKGDYKVEYKNGKILINGVTQPDSVTNKYKKYFRQDGVTIKKENGKLNINIQ